MSKECDRRTLPPTKLIPKRPLGKTGYQATIYGLGGLFTLARHDRHDEAVVFWSPQQATNDRQTAVTLNERISENGHQKKWLTAFQKRTGREFYRHCAR